MVVIAHPPELPKRAHVVAADTVYGTAESDYQGPGQEDGD
jgi:hypothetical protein